MREVVLNKFDNRVTLTVRVKVSRQMRIRVKMSVLLIRLAAWVLGCGVSVLVNDRDAWECNFKNDYE